MIRLLLFLLGGLTVTGRERREESPHRWVGPPHLEDDPRGRIAADAVYPYPYGEGEGRPGPPSPGRPHAANDRARARPFRDNREAGRPRRRIPRWVTWGTATVVAGLMFRRAIASVVLMALSAVLHFAGFNVHLPSVRFAWPWQSISAGSTSNTDLGPWVLQKIQGITKPALGEANFSFYFTHKVSKNIGPLPCWYARTFYAVAHASATVDLNPGPAWWAPSAGHYRLQVLSHPEAGKPGQVTVAMVLPRPQLPQGARDISVDNISSKPVATQHSWTYPGLLCGTLLRPQFPESVLYSQAQQIAFYKSTHAQEVTRPLTRTAESAAVRIIRDNFIQPTVNAFGYTLDRFTVRWITRP